MEPLDVEIAPHYKKLQLLLAFVSCGVGWVVLYLSSRSWPARISEKGMTLQNGKKVAWSKLTNVERVTAVDQRGRRVTGRLDLKFGKTTVKIVPQSIVPGQAVLDTISEILGERVETG